MKRILFACLLMIATKSFSQNTYYWVGGTAATTSITIAANWNTAINGSGTTRSSSTNAADILIFDGTNVGGATPATGATTVMANGSITCAQIRLVNNANISFIRNSTGTSTITISGGAGDDFFVEAGSSFSIPITTAGSIRMAMAATCTGRVSGSVSMVTTQQARFDNTTTGTPGSFVFTTGSSFYTNITATSSSYAFGGNTQSSEKWVVFEDGSNLYYDGGYSPVSNVSTFTAVEFKPGSTWHQRAAVMGGGSFFNRRNFGNIIVESGGVLTADGPIYRINNLTVNSGCGFVTHTSGQTAVVGNIVCNGTISAPAASSNEILMASNTAQTISGTGAMSVGSLIVGASANVTLSKNVAVDQIAVVDGKINFGTNQLSGNATFNAEGIITPIAGTGNTTTGAYIISGNVGITGTSRGQLISGAGIPANTVIVGISTTLDSLYISNALTATGTGVALSVTTPGATLETANTNGFDPATGTVILTGNKTYKNNINYIIDGATVTPFGISTGSTSNAITAGFVEVNAPVTTNSTVVLTNHLGVSGKITLRVLDTVHILPGAVINGTFNASNYIATVGNSTTGQQSIVYYEGMASATTIPVGTTTNYLPVTLTPANASAFTIAVFQGITSQGTINGTPLTTVQKQTVVDAVWNINRLSGTGNTNLQLGWAAALEGATFTTLANTDIGIIYNTGSSYALPIGTGDNTANTASATISNFGAYAIGSVPLTQPFIFNALPAKTYGNADFNGGATSLNTTQPIVYTSNNAAVATIVAGNIHIVGAGSADITASQVSDGFYPAASITKTLTVAKAALTIKADDQTRFEGQANPTLTATYTGFVLGETTAVLLTPATIATTATISSTPGTYPITVTGATAANYTITQTNGTLTVVAKQNQTITFAAPATKTYGNADFAHGATSTNATIPITFVSSNPAVATVVGSNIHIVGAGTTNITASQAGSVGYFAATDVVRTLTVNKAALAIKVRDTVRNFGTANPPFTITYTGFVLGETAANLSAPVSVTTIATTTSAPGYYVLTPQATAANYNITFTSGTLTILPASGTGTAYINAFMSNSSTLTIRLFSPTPQLTDIVLYNNAGQPLRKKNILMINGFVNTTMDISTLPAGIYVVKVVGLNLQKVIAILK